MPFTTETCVDFSLDVVFLYIAGSAACVITDLHLRGFDCWQLTNLRESTIKLDPLPFRIDQLLI